ncbi:spherulation-specific family 4 protein [Streptomyces sp. NPDC002018]|uniref:spherulation-specific family 4 protein n=1 Tax=Streptomyces sp. NPDC002018 TaxID=3364629 RepID=UPI0036960978
MPHLTRTGHRPSATERGRLGFGVPGYAHPLLAPVEWAELTRPGTPLHWAVLNVADGPGDRPDPHCLAAAGRLIGTGARVLGHIDLAHGTRRPDEIVTEAERFLDWYRVGGFFLDRCPTGREELPEIRRTTAALEALLAAGAAGAGRDGRPTESSGGPGEPYGRPGEPYGRPGGGHLVLGHGTHPHPGYAEAADQLVTFSGPWTDYRWSQAAEWTADHPPERFVHLVHGVPRGHLDEAMRIARWQGAGTIFFTDHRGRPDRGGPGERNRGAWERGERGEHRTRTGHDGPFASLPGYWDEIVSRVGPGVSE